MEGSESCSLATLSHLFMLDAAVHGLKPTATLTQSHRDPQGRVSLSGSFVDHWDHGQPQ